MSDINQRLNGDLVKADFDTYKYGDGKNVQSNVRYLTRAPKFKVGDRIRHDAEYWGTGTVVEGNYVENDGEMLVPVQYDNGKFCDQNFESFMQLIPALELEPALKPRAPRMEVRVPYQYNKFDSSKLTEANKYSEEPSTYKSATDGNIPLSFKGRHLMQRLRTSTMAAIQFTNWHCAAYG